MLSNGIVLLHDIAWPHTAGDTLTLVRQFRWEQFNHLFYSPELALYDYHLFLHVKSDIGGQRFETDDEVKTADKKLREG
ncbi:hypothetical protein J6590_045170 [Homalodisca vitripennis]|nr:hypothetical protein J6590_045170 [Homalodisca vitripennis]